MHLPVTPFLKFYDSISLCLSRWFVSVIYVMLLIFFSNYCWLKYITVFTIPLYISPSWKKKNAFAWKWCFRRLLLKPLFKIKIVFKVWCYFHLFSLKGRNILNGARREDYSIHVGLDGSCFLPDITMQSITCYPPKAVPRTNQTDANTVYVIVSIILYLC